MVYNGEKYDIICLRIESFEAGGAAVEPLRGNVLSNPLNLMWLVPTEGSEIRKSIKTFPAGERFFSFYEKVSFACLSKRERMML